MSETLSAELVADEPVAPPPSNTMGLIGFILSIIGLMTLGILSPIALLISIIGTFKPPRTMAVVGLVVSLLGCVMLLLVGVLVFAGFASWQMQKDMHRQMQIRDHHFQDSKQLFEQMEADHNRAMEQLREITPPPEVAPQVPDTDAKIDRLPDPELPAPPAPPIP